MPSKLTVALPSLPKLEDLDFAVARTLDVHTVLLQLIGAPLFSWGPHIENIYATNVTCSEDFKTWTVSFSRNAKFSDGTPLMAKHWYHSIARTIQKGAGVHFNPKKDLVGGDKTKDGYCEGLQLIDNQVCLYLKEPNKNFPRLLGKVEATILPIQDNHTYQIDLIKGPSSGPYSLESYSEKKITLKLNPHFPAHQSRAQFERIEIHAMSDEEAIEARLQEKVDLIFPLTQPSLSIRTKLQKQSQTHRNFGHTYFIGFRNKPKSPWQQKPELRQALATLLSQIPPLEPFEKTSTLLIGEGMGRLSKGPLFRTSLATTDLPPLSIAAVDKPITRHIIHFLETSGLSIKTTWVKTFNDLYSEKNLQTDAIIGWNDFCGKDPYIALYNALNPDRPLWADHGNVLRQKLTQIQSIDDLQEKDRAYQELHRTILENALAIPVFQQWFDAFADPSLNLKTMHGSALWTIGK